MKKEKISEMPNWVGPTVFTTHKKIERAPTTPSIEEFKKLEERVSQLERFIADIPYAEETDGNPVCEKGDLIALKESDSDGMRYVLIKSPDNYGFFDTRLNLFSWFEKTDFRQLLEDLEGLRLGTISPSDFDWYTASGDDPVE